MSDFESNYDYDNNSESFTEEEKEEEEQQYPLDPEQEQFNTPEDMFEKNNKNTNSILSKDEYQNKLQKALKQIQDKTGLNEGQAYKVLHLNQFNFDKVEQVKIRDYEEFISENYQQVNTDYCIKCQKKNTKLESLGCNHNFCQSCYCNYIQKLFQSGNENYIFETCPFESCKLILDKEKFEKFLNDEQIQKYHDQILNSSIEKYPFIRKHRCQKESCEVEYFSSYTHKQLYQPDFNQMQHFKDHCGSFICDEKHVLINCLLYKQWQDLQKIIFQNFEDQGVFIKKFRLYYFDSIKQIKNIIIQDNDFDVEDIKQQELISKINEIYVGLFDEISDWYYYFTSEFAPNTGIKETMLFFLIAQFVIQLLAWCFILGIMNFKEVETQYMIEMESQIMKEKNVIKWMCMFLKFKFIFFFKILINSLKSFHKAFAITVIMELKLLPVLVHGYFIGYYKTVLTPDMMMNMELEQKKIIHQQEMQKNFAINKVLQHKQTMEFQRKETIIGQKNRKRSKQNLDLFKSRNSNAKQQLNFSQNNNYIQNLNSQTFKATINTSNKQEQEIQKTYDQNLKAEQKHISLDANLDNGFSSLWFEADIERYQSMTDTIEAIFEALPLSILQYLNNSILDMDITQDWILFFAFISSVLTVSFYCITLIQSLFQNDAIVLSSWKQKIDNLREYKQLNEQIYKENFLRKKSEISLKDKEVVLYQKPQSVISELYPLPKELSIINQTELQKLQLCTQEGLYTVKKLIINQNQNKQELPYILESIGVVISKIQRKNLNFELSLIDCNLHLSDLYQIFEMVDITRIIDIQKQGNRNKKVISKLGEISHIKLNFNQNNFSHYLEEDIQQKSSPWAKLIQKLKTKQKKSITQTLNQLQQRESYISNKNDSFNNSNLVNIFKVKLISHIYEKIEINLVNTQINYNFLKQILECKTNELILNLDNNKEVLVAKGSNDQISHYFQKYSIKDFTRKIKLKKQRDSIQQDNTNNNIKQPLKRHSITLNEESLSYNLKKQENNVPKKPVNNTIIHVNNKPIETPNKNNQILYTDNFNTQQSERDPNKQLLGANYSSFYKQREQFKSLPSDINKSNEESEELITNQYTYNYLKISLKQTNFNQNAISNLIVLVSQNEYLKKLEIDFSKNRFDDQESINFQKLQHINIKSLTQLKITASQNILKSFILGFYSLYSSFLQNCTQLTSIDLNFSSNILIFEQRYLDTLIFGKINEAQIEQEEDQEENQDIEIQQKIQSNKNSICRINNDENLQSNNYLQQNIEEQKILNNQVQIKEMILNFNYNKLGDYSLDFILQEILKPQKEIRTLKLYFFKQDSLRNQTDKFTIRGLKNFLVQLIKLPFVKKYLQEIEIDFQQNVELENYHIGNSLLQYKIRGKKKMEQYLKEHLKIAFFKQNYCQLKVIEQPEDKIHQTTPSFDQNQLFKLYFMESCIIKEPHSQLDKFKYRVLIGRQQKDLMDETKTQNKWIKQLQNNQKQNNQSFMDQTAQNTVNSNIPTIKPQAKTLFEQQIKFHQQDMSVSRRQCEIYYDNKQKSYFLQDFGYTPTSIKLKPKQKYAIFKNTILNIGRPSTQDCVKITILEADVRINDKGNDNQENDVYDDFIEKIIPLKNTQHKTNILRDYGQQMLKFQKNAKFQQKTQAYQKRKLRTQQSIQLTQIMNPNSQNQEIDKSQLSALSPNTKNQKHIQSQLSTDIQLIEQSKQYDSLSSETSSHNSQYHSSYSDSDSDDSLQFENSKSPTKSQKQIYLKEEQEQGNIITTKIKEKIHKPYKSKKRHNSQKENTNLLQNYNQKQQQIRKKNKSQDTFDKTLSFIKLQKTLKFDSNNKNINSNSDSNSSDSQNQNEVLNIIKQQQQLSLQQQQSQEYIHSTKLEPQIQIQKPINPQDDSFDKDTLQSPKLRQNQSNQSASQRQIKVNFNQSLENIPSKNNIQDNINEQQHLQLNQPFLRKNDSRKRSILKQSKQKFPDIDEPQIKIIKIKMKYGINSIVKSFHIKEGQTISIGTHKKSDLKIDSQFQSNNVFAPKHCIIGLSYFGEWYIEQSEEQAVSSTYFQLRQKDQQNGQIYQLKDGMDINMGLTTFQVSIHSVDEISESQYIGNSQFINNNQFQ